MAHHNATFAHVEYSINIKKITIIEEMRKGYNEGTGTFLLSIPIFFIRCVLLWHTLFVTLQQKS